MNDNQAEFETTTAKNKNNEKSPLGPDYEKNWRFGRRQTHKNYVHLQIQTVKSVRNEIKHRKR